MSTLVTDQRRVSVGIGQIAVSTDPTEVLVAYGLGSCVGVTFYDPGTRSGGMVHFLLQASEGRVSYGKEPARYADWGVSALLAELTRRGSYRAYLVIKLSGGAAVLAPAPAEQFKLVARNAEAIKEQLKRLGLRVTAEDLGGTKVRTMELQIAAGRTYVRTADSAPTELDETNHGNNSRRR